ncbi:Peptidase family M3 [Bacillus sp. THAF10]|uniref:hypothetical protein n=1 Tax=Bacillus sp. THAF10 TaxID=2587848 RepID=UPI001267FA9E|nr:hypothetical protein [Bacillus sp. THAF10]QFT87523.1 Peptidase family M3 [Bacillus sp. THAF10]
MIVGFEKLPHKQCIEEWKEVYHSAIVALDQLYQEELELEYEVYTKNSENPRLQEIKQQKHEIMTDEILVKELSLKKELFEQDPVWRRRIEVFLLKMQQESLDSNSEVVAIQQQLQSNLLKSKIQVKGAEYTLGNVHSNVMNSTDRELRRLLFLEAKKIGKENEELFRTLIEKRNQLASEYGYRSYYQFRCSFQDLDIAAYMNEMKALFEKAESHQAYWEKEIIEKFKWNALHQYDQYFCAFHFLEEVQSEKIFKAETLEKALEDVIKGLGIPERLPITTEFAEIAFGGFCMNINPNDCRLVVNKRNGFSVFVSALHELGHAVDGVFSSYDYPELYRFYSSIAAEGLAEFYQTMVVDKQFLRNHFSISEEQIDQLSKQKSLMDLIMVKMNFYYSLVEFELYENPTRDFQKVANDCYMKVFGNRGEAFHPASELFYVESPAFFQDYNFALAIREMLLHTFHVMSPYGEKDIFLKLKDHYMKPNQLYSWQKRVQDVCGEPFTFAYLRANLAKIPK